MIFNRSWTHILYAFWYFPKSQISTVSRPVWYRKLTLRGSCNFPQKPFFQLCISLNKGIAKSVESFNANSLRKTNATKVQCIYFSELYCTEMVGAFGHVFSLRKRLGPESRYILIALRILLNPSLISLIRITQIRHPMYIH